MDQTDPHGGDRQDGHRIAVGYLAVAAIALVLGIICIAAGSTLTTISAVAFIVAAAVLVTGGILVLRGRAIDVLNQLEVSTVVGLMLALAVILWLLQLDAPIPAYLLCLIGPLAVSLLRWRSLTIALPQDDDTRYENNSNT